MKNTILSLKASPALSRAKQGTSDFGYVKILFQTIHDLAQ